MFEFAIKNHLKKFVFLILLQFFCTSYADEIVKSDLSKISIPPRNINDVLQVLDSSKVSNEEIEKAKLVIAQPLPPEGADKKTLAFFYRKQAAAYEKLGMPNEATNARKKVAYEYPEKENTKIYVNDLMDYGGNESTTGHKQDSIKAFNDAIDFMNESGGIRQFGGYMLSSKRALIIQYVSIGKISEAKKILDSIEYDIVTMRTFKGYTTFGQSWEATYQFARATVFKGQMNWVESEYAYLKGINAYKAIYERVSQDSRSLDELDYTTTQVKDSTNTPRFSAQNIIYREKDLAQVYIAQGKLIDAEYYARDSLNFALRTFGKTSLAANLALLSLADTISEQGRYAEAEILSRKSVELLQQSGIPEDSGVLALSKKRYANALIFNKKYLDAEKVYLQLQATLTKFPKLAETFRLNDSDFAIAFSALGKKQEAEDMALDILKKNEKNLSSNAAALTFNKAFYASTLQQNGKYQEADAMFKLSIPSLINQIRTRANNDRLTHKNIIRNNFVLESYLASLARQARADPSLSDALAKEAFSIADFARGSGVQKALTQSAARATIQDPQLASLAREEQDLHQRITTISELLTSLRSASNAQQLPEIQVSMQQDITKLSEQRQSIRKKIDSQFPSYTNLVDPQPPSVDLVQKQLNPKEVLITWYFGNEESYVWAISKDQPVRFSSLNLKSSDMAKEVAQLRKALDPEVSSVDAIPAFDVSLANNLYQQILAPVESSYLDKTQMIVVPHKELGELPLSLLVTKPGIQVSTAGTKFSGYRSVPWLARGISISQVPSAASFISLRTLPKASSERKNYVGFGDPYFSLDQEKQAQKISTMQMASRGIKNNFRSAPKFRGVSSTELAMLPRLADTSDEILEIAKVMNASQEDIFLHEKASVKQVTTMDLSNRKVVMFSTHGLMAGDLNGLTEPALALSSPMVTGDADDGLLTMSKVISLKLNADWVVLSACNTAAGDGKNEGNGSEAISGLGKAFFFAGARALLVSNWPVDSDAARILMSDIFKRQASKSNSEGETGKAQSVQAAMLDLLDQGGYKEGNTMKYSYAHPLFWAPFVLVGD